MHRAQRLPFGRAGRRTVLIAVAIAVAASLPSWLLHGGFWITVGTLTGIYAIAGVAWVVIGGFGGQATFGNSVFFGIGAYAAALAQTNEAWGPWIGLMLAIGAAGAAAVAIGLISFRSRGVYFALITFTTTLTFQIFAQYFGFTGGAVGLNLSGGATGWSNFAFASKNTYYFVVLVVLAATAAVAAALGRSSFGTELKAIRDSEDAAAACGVPVRSMKIAAFTVSAVLTCLAGWLYFEVVGFIDPDSAFGLTIATLIPVVAMFGGSRRVAGPIVGAVVLVPLQQYTGATGLGGLPNGVGLVIFAVLVAAVMWIEPRGLVMLLLRGGALLRGQAVVRAAGSPPRRAAGSAASSPPRPESTAEPGTAAEPDAVAMLAKPRIGAPVTSSGDVQERGD